MSILVCCYQAELDTELFFRETKIKGAYSLERPIEKALSLKITYSPIVFFILFLASNSLLVFSNLSLVDDLAIILFGILVPFVIALVLLKNPVSASDKNSFFQTEWFNVGPWLWILLAALFVTTRFYRLTSLPWPISDDGFVAYFANRLATQGDWRLLYGSARVEPLFIWGLAGWFKLFQSSLLAIKTYPVFVYFGVLVVGYFGARQYFSKTISFMTLWFLTFNFWTFYINRQCQVLGSLLFFECLVFYFLGIFLSSSSKKQVNFFWLLAICVGIGFYTYTAWPVVAVMTVLPVVLRTQYRLPGSAKRLIGFILIPLILALPLICARFSTGGVTYIQGLLGRSAGLDYLEALFWNGLGITRVDPSKLGWLNPCLGALFLIGFLELWRFRLSRISQWLLFAFLLFLLPGILTNNFDMARIIAVLPLICVFASMGMLAIISETPLPKTKKNIFFILLAVLSLGLDVYHYAGPGQFQDWDYFVSNKRHLMAVDFSRAYPILEAAHKNGVSLLILSNLNNNNLDQTLNVVSSPFGETYGPFFLNQSAQKAAILVNCNYESFLKREFPDSDWIWLSPDFSNDYGGLVLGFVPINSHTRKTLERWKKADQVFNQNNEIYMEFISQQSVDSILKDLYAHYPVFRGDRFLESVFWEKVAFYEEFQMKIPEAVAALKNGTKDGYDAAQFYNKLGVLFTLFANKEEAKSYFEKALKCQVNRTTAAENLKRLETM